MKEEKCKYVSYGDYCDPEYCTCKKKASKSSDTEEREYKNPNIEQCIEFLKNEHQFKSDGNSYTVMVVLNEVTSLKAELEAKDKEIEIHKRGNDSLIETANYRFNQNERLELENAKLREQLDAANKLIKLSVTKDGGTYVGNEMFEKRIIALERFKALTDGK